MSESPVRSYNEWDPLEEVIVGRLDGATIPRADASVLASIPKSAGRLYRWIGGFKHPRALVDAGERDLESLIAILKQAGVTVRRPDPYEFSARVRTPHWSAKGFCASCPRDSLLVLGDEIIETPMAWRSRYFESHAYRSILKDYFARGARWTAAPRPQLLDALYDSAYEPPEEGEPMRYLVNEFEPVFDAADFVRCGHDVFYMRSNVTNASGVEWLRRHYGDTYRFHEVPTLNRRPMHIDSTFLPLAPGKVLVNPERIDRATLPATLSSWELLPAPRPDPVKASRIATYAVMCSPWISMNVLMLDSKRVIVEESQVSLIRALEGWGFEPISCPFASFALFGGAFHCATLDVRRRGELQSYFDGK